MTLHDDSGPDIREGDQVRYQGEPGSVEFVVVARSVDDTRNWYLERFPMGGLMIAATGFGNVFVSADDIDDRLEFVARKAPR
jgi:hypothetical protein